jgi:gliding motility-associated-like protein
MSKKLPIFLLFCLTFNICLTQETFKCNEGPFKYRKKLLNRLDISGSSFDFIPYPDIDSNPIQIGSVLSYNTMDNIIYGLDWISMQELRLFQVFPDGVISVIDTIEVDDNYQHSGGGTFKNGTNNIYYLATQTPYNGIQAIGIIDVTGTNTPILIELETMNGEPASLGKGFAIDPISGLLYGVSALDFRLVVINTETGVTDNISFPSNENIISFEEGGTMKALYFDNYGNLFGIQQNILYYINKETGIMNQVSSYINFETDTDTDGGDMCDCSFAPALQLDIKPELAYACSDAEFTYRFFYKELQDQSGIILRDTLPTGFIFKELTYNNFNATVSGLGTNQLTVSNINLPAEMGIDSLQVIVEIPENALGNYENQAYMNGFVSDFVGSSDIVYASDYAQSLLIKEDATPFTVEELSLGTINDSFFICPDSLLTIRPLEFASGFEFNWETGSNEAQIEVSAAGIYNLTLSNNCESLFIPIHVEDAGIDIELDAAVSVTLGDELELSPILSPSTGDYDFFWFSLSGDSIFSCVNCLETTVVPVSDELVTFSASNEYACTATQEISIQVKTDVYFPNAFSPNNDGFNDTFIPLSKNAYIIEEFKIFDRWGNIFYENKNIQTNDLSAGWNGRTKGKLADTGVYVWYAKIIAGEKVLNFKGEITLIE